MTQSPPPPSDPGPSASEANDPSQLKKQMSSPTFWSDFFAFRTMVTPMIIKVLFWILVAITVIATLVGLVSGFATGDPATILLALILTPIYLVLGLIWVRVSCELLILFFRIHETLVEIRDKPDSDR